MSPSPISKSDFEAMESKDVEALQKLKDSSELVKDSVQSIENTVQATEENLASLRKTIEALDNFESRWKV